MHLHDLDGDRVVGVVDEVEYVGVAQDLLEEADLPLRVLPLAVEHVHGEGAAEALHLQAQSLSIRMSICIWSHSRLG